MTPKGYDSLDYYAQQVRMYLQNPRKLRERYGFDLDVQHSGRRLFFDLIGHGCVLEIAVKGGRKYALLEVSKGERKRAYEIPMPQRRTGTGRLSETACAEVWERLVLRGVREFDRSSKP